MDNLMPLLQTKELSLALGQKNICHPLTMDVHAHETWGILGQNGCGKTTLLHTLAGLRTPTKGTILLKNQPLTHLSTPTLAKWRGILFQELQTAFPQTVWEYCKGGRYPHLPYFAKETAEERAIILNALKVMALDHLQQRNIAHLSGGEKRRLALAALLAQAPTLYLLDEPTNHLDVRYQMQALKHIKGLTQTSNTAAIMSLHDINLAQRFCTHVLLLLPDGRTLQGPSQTILTLEHLECAYQCAMVTLSHHDITYWMPK
jgi:iron complex transport system ATP-binding protein